MTGHQVLSFFYERGYFLIANINPLGASWVKGTTCRRVEWTGNLPLQDEAIALSLNRRVRDRYG
jgi:hypothetical protein